MKIQGAVFIVTGAASGLGAATARMLIEQGAKVVLADLNESAGMQTAAELGSNALFVQTDVTNEDSARQAFSAAVSMGTLRGLINCAGIAPAGRCMSTLRIPIGACGSLPPAPPTPWSIRSAA